MSKDNMGFDVDFQQLLSMDIDTLLDTISNQVGGVVNGARRTALDSLAADIHPTNAKNGFWGEPEIMDKYVAKLGLIHSEVTEVLEALRKSQGADKVTEEFADIFIRTLDLYHVLVQAGEASPELYGVILDKMKANASRPPKHGNRWG